MHPFTAHGIEVVELEVEHIDLDTVPEQPTTSLLARVAQINAVSVALSSN